MYSTLEISLEHVDILGLMRQFRQKHSSSIVHQNSCPLSQLVRKDMLAISKLGGDRLILNVAITIANLMLPELH